MSTRRSCRRLPALALLCAAATMAAACDHSTAPQPQHGSAQMYIQAVFNSANVPSKVVVEISAADLNPNPLIYNLTVVNDTAKGTVTIPAGSARTITIKAYDATGVETYTGTATQDVQVGTNNSVTIPLTHSGDQPIVATFTTFTVSLSSTTVSVNVGANATIAVTVKGSDGSTITPAAGSVTCATDNPAIATVAVGSDNSSCVVTGVLTGQSTEIMATYSGLGAAATVNVN